MRNSRLWPLVFVVGALFWRGVALGAGFGAVGSGAVLGQALDFVVPLRLEPGDTLTPECLAAEVTMGERRLAAGAVRTSFEMAGAELARVRVRTLISIDEPVVGVVVQAGCTSRISRRFVLFADPPHLAQAAAAAPAPADAAPEAAAPAGVAAPAARPPETPVAPKAVAAKPARTERLARRTPRVAARPEKVAAARRSPQREAARLKLETPEPAPAAPAPAASSAVEEAWLAVAQAASAAQAAASAASAANERIAGLERTVESLRGEAKASRDVAAQLRERLARAEEAGRWTWPLLAAVLFLTALAAGLAWRLNSAQRQRQQAWAPASVVPQPRGPSLSPTTLGEMTPSKLPTAPIPFVTSELRVPESPRPRGSVPAWPPPAPAPEYADAEVTRPLTPMPAAKAGAPEYPYDAAMARTQVLAATAEVDAPPRDLTIEELIDLEQQAEFFVVLGQDEAAIDLLVEHLRHTGGSSPLPYLKLLEIYRRRGEREEYERTRVRFNQRFNAYAPDWDVDLTHGRTLESYPGVVPRLQQVWPRPLDAMAELEALLFRKSRGDLFELPAYRDVLMLYAMARDLLDREAVDTGNVDLLLPLSDGGEFSSTTPTPYLGGERDSGFMPSGFDDRPTAPVDLDLTSGHDRPASLFDTLDPLDERPRR